MSNASIITTKGRNIILNRAYTETADLSATLYLPITQIQIGINNQTPNIADTSLSTPVPIEDGTTCDDGSNTLTGSSGGDNSTDNTTTYKEGGGNSDVTAQNLIANDTNVSKIWTIADLDTDGNDASATQYTAIWFYIKDATALAKFKTSGTCLEVKIGNDDTDYYSVTKEASDLSTGWNWITDSGVLNTWTESGTVAGDLDTFIIEVTTNNATDEFVAGDVIYDLLRQWELSDTIIDIETDYPTFDYTNNEVTIRAKLSTIKANGFDINGLNWTNEDTIPLMADEDTFNAESKGSTDELIFETRNRIL